MTPSRQSNPFFRWSFLKMMLNLRHLMKNWQVGDGREASLVDHVLKTARPGDVADAIRAIDAFAYETSFLMNVGDEKGLILDKAVTQARPKRILELGTYCGYSALRMSQVAPDAHIVTLEFNADNAALARRIFAHAGVSSRITVVVGSLGDGGKTIRALNEQHQLKPGSVDAVFIDHAKEAYMPDLRVIEEQGWLHRGSVVIADNVKFPGAPDYRTHMKQAEGRDWHTTEHETYVEYQSLLKDLVLVSERLVA